MKIEVLGTGCPKCAELYENVRQAVEKEGIDAEITKVTDLNEITGHGVMITPALVIDGKVAFSGKVPSSEEIIARLK